MLNSKIEQVQESMSRRVNLLEQTVMEQTKLIQDLLQLKVAVRANSRPKDCSRGKREKSASGPRAESAP